MTGSIAATGNRVTKRWFTDLEITNSPTVGGVAFSSLYISVINEPTEGKYPTVTAGGELLNGTYGPTDFASSTHNHDETYSAIDHNHSGTYEPVLGNPSANAYLLSSTSAGVRSWISKNDVYTAFVTLTYGANVTWKMSDGYNRKLTLTGDCALTMSELASGMSGCLIVVQNASGGHTLSFADTDHNKIIDGGLLTLDETANRVNILTFVCDGTDCFWSYGNN